MKCLIIEDEPIACKIILEYCEEIEFLEVMGVVDNPMKAIPFLEKQQIDLMFLDIQMPKLNGIEFLKMLKVYPACILITAYPDYALEGFNLDVVDYLLKPVSFDRFLKACLKANEFQMSKNRPVRAEMQEYFFIKCDNRIEKIDIHEIHYIEALQNYITIHTSKRKYIAYITLASFIEQLPENKFMRIHKSYVVAVNSIQYINKDEVFVGSISLPISKSYKIHMNEFLINTKFIKR